MKKSNKRGDILIENVIFIILNVVFISILLLFLWRQSSAAALVEQTHAKQISLIIDSAKPLMEVKLNMNKAKKISDKEGIDFREVVSVTGNVVKIKLTQRGGYEYSFFNDVEVIASPVTDDENEYTGVYRFRIDEK